MLIAALNETAPALERRFAASQQFSRFRSVEDIQRAFATVLGAYRGRIFTAPAMRTCSSALSPLTPKLRARCRAPRVHQ